MSRASTAPVSASSLRIMANQIARAAISAASNAAAAQGDILVTNEAISQLNAQFLGSAGAPASATAPGVQDQIAWDANYLYICVAPDTWKRVAIATW
jgi:hypothetical protein